ncbi:MAG: hypothetical protein ACR2K2_09505, partial [Mycobacteriales bacterium]
PAEAAQTPVLNQADRIPMMAAPAAPAAHAAPAAPAAAAVPAAAVAAAAPAPRIARWLPTGTGVWLHDWRKSENGDAREVVTQAQRRGLSHLYVQTGSTGKGWIGEEVLSQLMPAVVGTGLSVIAWDFPKLADPEGDARRMALAATWSRPGAARVSAVAPDIETAAEGTRVSGEAVRRYYAALRAALPAAIPILATVPWPSEKRIGKYPYAETAPLADAFVPMAYWYNRSPKVVTDTSMNWLQQFGKPIMPVGQGYDGRIDSPSLPADPDPAGSVQAFVNAARAGGAQSISLWSWQTMGPQQWDVLGRSGAAFAPRAAAPAPVPVAEPEPSLVDQLLGILGRSGASRGGS